MQKSPTLELPIHVDVNVPDREEELQRLLGLGAHLVETKSHRIVDLEETWTVMRDPEGNGFCIQTRRTRHHNATSATSPSRAPSREDSGSSGPNALGWPEEELDEDFLQQLRDAGLDERELTGFYVTRNPDGSRPRFLFQRREKSRPESYPIHLDFRADEREAEIDRARRAGASVVETKSNDDRTWTVMRDPDGNPFCLE
jgi:hypothetical protein